MLELSDKWQKGEMRDDPQHPGRYRAEVDILAQIQPGAEEVKCYEFELDAPGQIVSARLR